MFLGSLKSVAARQFHVVFQGAIVDQATNGSLRDNFKQLIIILIIVELAFFVLATLDRRAYTKIFEKLSNLRYARYLRQGLLINDHGLSEVTSGDIANKVRSKADYFTSFYALADYVIVLPLGIISTAAVLYSKKPVFALAFLLIWAPSAYAFWKISKRRVDINKTANDSWDEYSGRFYDTLGNASTVKQIAAESYEEQKTLKVGAKLWSKYASRFRSADNQYIALDLINFLVIALVNVYGLTVLSEGKISVGTYVVLVSYVGLAISDITRVGNMIRNASESIVRAVSLDELLEKYPPLTEPQNPRAAGNDHSIGFASASLATMTLRAWCLKTST